MVGVGTYVSPKAQGLSLQWSLAWQVPYSISEFLSPTQRAIQALGYVRPFLPQTGSYSSRQPQGKPRKIKDRQTKETMEVTYRNLNSNVNPYAAGG